MLHLFDFGNRDQEIVVDKTRLLFHQCNDFLLPAFLIFLVKLKLDTIVRYHNLNFEHIQVIVRNLLRVEEIFGRQVVVQCDRP